MNETLTFLALCTASYVASVLYFTVNNLLSQLVSDLLTSVFPRLSSKMLRCILTEQLFVFETAHRFFSHVYVYACTNLSTDQLNLLFCPINSINRNEL